MTTCSIHIHFLLSLFHFLNTFPLIFFSPPFPLFLYPSPFVSLPILLSSSSSPSNPAPFLLIILVLLSLILLNLFLFETHPGGTFPPHLQRGPHTWCTLHKWDGSGDCLLPEAPCRWWTCCSRRTWHQTGLGSPSRSKACHPWNGLREFMWLAGIGSDIL